MNRAQLFLTKGWFRLLRAKYIKVSEISLPNGQSQEVVVFSSDESLLIGQVTPFNTTIIHERVFRFEKLLNYTIIHESVHKQQWYRYIIYPLSIFCIPALFMLPFSIGLLLKTVIFGTNTEQLTSVVLLVISTLYFLLPFLYSWFLEFVADYRAIKELGFQYILEALSEARSDRKRPDLLSVILARMTHPPISLTVAVFKFLNKQDYKS